MRSGDSGPSWPVRPGTPRKPDDLEQRAEETTAQPPRDRYLLLLAEYRHQGRLPEALPLLQEASRRQNDNFSVWMILGNCYADLGKLSDAVECYDMASALWPEAPWPYLCRGLACMDQWDYRRARAAFDEVIRVAAGDAAGVLQPGPGEVPPG